jgi:hypothetical protein
VQVAKEKREGVKNNPPHKVKWGNKTKENKGRERDGKGEIHCLTSLQPTLKAIGRREAEPKRNNRNHQSARKKTYV